MADEEGDLSKLMKQLSKLDREMKKTLKRYGMVDLYGYFLTTTVLMAISIGIYSTHLFGATGLGFSVFVVFLSLIGGLISFIIVGYVLPPLYSACYKDMDILKKLLSYQIADLFIGIVLALYFGSGFPLGGSVLVFGILAIIHPISGNLWEGKKDIDKMKDTLDKIYKIIVILQGLVTLILQFAKLV